MTNQKIGNSKDKDPDLLTDAYLDETVILSHALTDEVITKTKDEDKAKEIIKP